MSDIIVSTEQAKARRLVYMILVRIRHEGTLKSSHRTSGCLASCQLYMRPHLCECPTAKFEYFATPR